VLRAAALRAPVAFGGAAGIARGIRAPCAAVNVSELESRADAARVARWDAFVSACPEATFFHRAAWRTVLRNAFGHRPYFLYAESDGRIQGVLPLARQKSVLFGDALISTPFCVYGGVAAERPEAREALERAAVELGERLGVDHIEFRNLVPRREDWVRRTGFATFRRDISSEPDTNLLQIPRKQRAEVRKGIERNLVTVASRDADGCWDLYARSVHRLGTPVYARRYFRELSRAFGTDCEFYFVRRDGVPVASLLNFYFRDEVLPYYAGSSGGGRDGEVHPVHVLVAHEPRGVPRRTAFRLRPQPDGLGRLRVQEELRLRAAAARLRVQARARHARPGSRPQEPARGRARRDVEAAAAVAREHGRPVGRAPDRVAPQSGGGGLFRHTM
jgi:FemAB-related protein (PEP-CTERM system-associated)